MIKRKVYSLAVIVCVLFAQPLYALTAADDNTGTDKQHITHLYDDVNMIASLKLDYGKQKMVLKAVYPKLTHMDTDMADNSLDNMPADDNADSQMNADANQSADGISALNDLIHQLIQDEMTTFRQEVKQNAALQKQLPIKVLKNNLYIDYDTSLILSGGEHIISFRFSIQRYIAGMAHPYLYYRVINYNIDQSAEIQLNDLFTPDARYLDFLSDYSRSVLNKRLADKSMLEAGTIPIADHFKIWNLKKNGILITFGPGQVAPNVNGTETVLVPYSAFKNFSSPMSPVASCIKNPRHCSSNNLLTGGFIDEAKLSLRGALLATKQSHASRDCHGCYAASQ